MGYRENGEFKFILRTIEESKKTLKVLKSFGFSFYGDNFIPELPCLVHAHRFKNLTYTQELNANYYSYELIDTKLLIGSEAEEIE